MASSTSSTESTLPSTCVGLLLRSRERRGEGTPNRVASPPLSCEEIVLRALLKRNWCHEDTKRIKADAFIRDPKKDLDGLSVNIRSKTEVASWLATFSRSFGADTLHTGSIRDIDQELDVGQEEKDAEAYPEHAIITGLAVQRR